MTLHTLNRTAFETSRLMEFFSEKELTLQIGLTRDQWAQALLKELLDNSLDACEAAGIAPAIHVQCEVGDPDSMSVTDNGPGIPSDIITSSLNYATRTSSNAMYVSPSRGQLGNALKCLYAAAFVVDGSVGRITIDTQGQLHQIEVRCDTIRQEPVITHAVTEGDVKIGTKITVHWPELASVLSSHKKGDFYIAKKMLWKFEALNPHAGFRIVCPIDDYCYSAEPTLVDIYKWTATMPTSAHWYSAERLGQLIAAHLKRADDLPMGKFVAQFRGLSASAKQKTITTMTGLTGKTLSCLVEDNDISLSAVSELLTAMQQQSDLVKPEKLGSVGSVHLKSWMHGYDVREESFKYRMVKTVVGGVPYVIELAMAIFISSEERLVCSSGVNFTPMLIACPFKGVESFLSENRIDAYDPILFLIHVISPSVAFTDRGKSQVTLPMQVLLEVREALELLTKDWRKLKRQADRDGRVNQRHIDKALKDESDGKMTIKDAAYQIMTVAYLKASNNGTLPANARQIMYAARPLIIELTGKGSPWKDSRRFTAGLLPDFITENPKLTETWDVVFDARGHLYEPHTNRRVDLGTLGVRNYLKSWSEPVIAKLEGQLFNLQMLGTHGPKGRYRFALFIEKEGFWELLKKAKVAERYDLAIMSTKGMSTTAARTLIESLAIEKVTILVAHDFDKSGFTILHTLFNDTRRFTFKVKPHVIDLGLRLDDALAMGLEAEEVTYDSKCDPRDLLRKQGATETEANFLVQSGEPKNWLGQRIELNAMSSQIFIDWLDRGLLAAGVEKVLPDLALANETYRQAVLRQRGIVQFKAMTESVVDIIVPDGLLERIKTILSARPTEAWDDVVMELAMDVVSK